MKTQNVAQLIGYLKDDPVIYDKNGIVAKFVVATNKTFIDKETHERKESVEWHAITCFNDLAEIAKEHLKKGLRVYVCGGIKTTKWTDKEKIERYKTEIIADDFFITPGVTEGRAFQ